MSNDKYVFLVQHAYEVEGVDEIKLIGIFSSEGNARSFNSPAICCLH